MDETPLGKMVAIADEEALYWLEFYDRPGLDDEVERLRGSMSWSIAEDITKPIQKIEEELQEYFLGHLRDFRTPLMLLGTPFKRRYGESCLTSLMARPDLMQRLLKR